MGGRGNSWSFLWEKKPLSFDSIHGFHKCLRNEKIRCWTEGLTVKSTGCYSRGSRCGPQHLHDGSQPFYNVTFQQTLIRQTNQIKIKRKWGSYLLLCFTLQRSHSQAPCGVRTERQMWCPECKHPAITVSQSCHRPHASSLGPALGVTSRLRQPSSFRGAGVGAATPQDHRMCPKLPHSWSSHNCQNLLSILAISVKRTQLIL